MKQFDILLCKFPFTDVSTTKLRPVLVLAEIPGDNTIVTKISTKSKQKNRYEIPIQHELLNNSYVHLDVIFTLHKSLIQKKIGTIQDRGFQKRIHKQLSTLFLIQ